MPELSRSGQTALHDPERPEYLKEICEAYPSKPFVFTEQYPPSIGKQKKHLYGSMKYTERRNRMFQKNKRAAYRKRRFRYEINTTIYFWFSS